MLVDFPFGSQLSIGSFILYFGSLSILSVPSLQSIGFLGPGISLIGLATAKSPFIASAWLSLAVGLKSFSHSGFLVNLQVGLLNKLP